MHCNNTLVTLKLNSCMLTPLISFVWFFVLKFITCSNIAHSGLNVLCTFMLQGMCNNDGSFPKQGRYRELDSSTQKILKHQVSVCCQTYTSHFVKHSQDSESQQQQHQQQLITMQFPFTYRFIHCCFPSLPNQAFILCGSYFDAEKSEVWWPCLKKPDPMSKTLLTIVVQLVLL